MATAAKNRTPANAPLAVVQIGGKQYRVREGDELIVDKQSIAKGKLSLPAISVIRDGKLSGSGTVQAEVLGEVKGPKLIVFKMKPKKRYRVKTGHRQAGTQIRVTKIS